MTNVFSARARDFLIPSHGNGFRPIALRHHNLAVYGIIAVVAKLIVVIVVSSVPLAKVLPTAVTPSKLVELTNKARAEKGLKPLTVNRTLAAAAALKGGDMIAHGYFAHVSPTNVTPWYWFRKAGYSYSYAGENLAIDFTTSESLSNAWLASPSHRKNILNPNYRELGIAVVSGEFHGSPTIIAVQFFGTPVPKPTVKVVTPKAPVTPTTPSPTAVRVLGEEQQPDPIPTPTPEPAPEPVPPSAPAFIEPEGGSIVAGPKPWVTGEAEPGTTITVRSGETEVGHGTVSALGYFRIELSALPDGPTTLTATSTDSTTHKESAPSAPLAFSVDATAPSVSSEGSVVLPSIEYGHFDVFARVTPDATETVLALGDRRFALAPIGTLAVGRVDVRGTDATELRLRATDAAGNSSEAVLADLSAFEPTTIVSPAGPDFATRVKLVLLSRGVVLALLMFLTLALLLHILAQVRVQHHPTTVSTLLLIGFLAALFLV